MTRKHKHKKPGTIVIGDYFRASWNKLINADCDDIPVKHKKKKEKINPSVHVYEECPVEPLEEE